MRVRPPVRMRGFPLRDFAGPSPPVLDIEVNEQRGPFLEGPVVTSARNNQIGCGSILGTRLRGTDPRCTCRRRVVQRAAKKITWKGASWASPSRR